MIFKMDLNVIPIVFNVIRFLIFTFILFHFYQIPKPKGVIK